MSYDPTVGRWISEDPIAFEGGDTDLYRYVHNNPANRTDPTGLSDKGNAVVPTAPRGSIPTKGPNDLPSFLPGTYDIYIRAASEHAWICYVNVRTGETHTFGRYPLGAGGVSTADGREVIATAKVAGVQMDNDLLKEKSDYPHGVATRPPIRLTNPNVYGGTGFNWATNNCTTYARDTWYKLSGEYLSSTGNLLVYDDPAGINRCIQDKNLFDKMNSDAWKQKYWQRLNDSRFGPNTCR